MVRISVGGEPPTGRAIIMTDRRFRSSTNIDEQKRHASIGPLLLCSYSKTSSTVFAHDDDDIVDRCSRGEVANLR